MAKKRLKYKRCDNSTYMLVNIILLYLLPGNVSKHLITVILKTFIGYILEANNERRSTNIQCAKV